MRIVFHTANIRNPEGDVKSLTQLFFKKVKFLFGVLFNKVRGGDYSMRGRIYASELEGNILKNIIRAYPFLYVLPL